MKNWLSPALLSLFLVAPSVQAELPNLAIFTEQYSPFNFIDPDDKTNRVQGIAVDLMVEMLQKSGSSQTLKDIKLVPWARGYNDVQENTNTVLFSTTRTAERENTFKWVCPIAELKTELVALKSRAIKITKEADILNYVLATVRDDVGEELVIKAGVPVEKLSRATKYDANLKKVESGRADMYVGSMDSVASMCKTLGCDPEAFEPVYTLDISHLCYAINKNTDDKVVETLQKSLDGILAEGRFAELKKKYEKWE